MDKTESIRLLRRTLSEISTTMYYNYVDWKCCQELIPLTESERMAENMYRMMIFKAKSIGLMSKGFVILRTQKGIIPDPSTMYSVLRSMYELLFLFRCIYVSPKTDVERDLLFNLWKVKGNNNLIQVPDKELNIEEQRKKRAANNENKRLRMEIRNQMNRLGLSESIIDTIEYTVNKNSPTLKGFVFKHCEHCGDITDFCALDFSDNNMGAELSDDSYIYSHYSAHSHPSYLGLKHFEEMYINKEEDYYVQEILGHTCIYLTRFMKDFCDYKDSYNTIYNQNANQIISLISRIQ